MATTASGDWASDQLVKPRISINRTQRRRRLRLRVSGLSIKLSACCMFWSAERSLASAAGFCGADGCPQFIGISDSVLRREKHCAVVKLRSTLQRRHALPLNLMAVAPRLTAIKLSACCMFWSAERSLASAAGFCGADGSPRFIGISHSAPRREKHCAVVKLRSTLQRQHALPLNLMAVSLRLESC